MSILTTLRTKKVTSAVTLNFQVSPDVALKLEEAATKTKIPRYDICRVLVEQGLISLLEELSNEPEDFNNETEEA